MMLPTKKKEILFKNKTTKLKQRMLQYHVLSKGSLTQLLVENRSKNRNFGSLIAAKNKK